MKLLLTFVVIIIFVSGITANEGANQEFSPYVYKVIKLPVKGVSCLDV